jgi:hypothetical protein
VFNVQCSPLFLPWPFLDPWTLRVQCSVFAVAFVFALAAPRFSGCAVAMTKRTDKDVSGRGEGKPSPFIDTRVIYCGDNLVQLKRPPDAEPVETVVN